MNPNPIDVAFSLLDGDAGHVCDPELADAIVSVKKAREALRGSARYSMATHLLVLDQTKLESIAWARLGQSGRMARHPGGKKCKDHDGLQVALQEGF